MKSEWSSCCVMLFLDYLLVNNFISAIIVYFGFFEKLSLTARHSLNNDQKHGLQTSEPKRINEFSWTWNLHRGKQQQPTSFSKVKHKCYLFMTPPTNTHTDAHTFPTPGSPSLCPLPWEPGCRAPESWHAQAERSGSGGGRWAASWSPRQSMHRTHAAVLLRCTDTHTPLAWPSETATVFGGWVTGPRKE